MLPRSPIFLRSQARSQNQGTMSFSLTPGRNGDVLDLTNKIGISAFRTGIVSLQMSFDENSKDISLFQSQLNRRANTSGWNFKAGDILNTPDAKGVKRNLITHYGCLTEADIEASLTYIGQEKRKAQNNQMMVECLLGLASTKLPMKRRNILMQTNLLQLSSTNYWCKRQS